MKLLKNINSRRLAKGGVIFCVYYTFTNSVADIYLVAESSMEPTLSGGQVVLIKPINSSFGVQCGDLKVQN